VGRINLLLSRMHPLDTIEGATRGKCHARRLLHPPIKFKKSSQDCIKQYGLTHRGFKLHPLNMAGSVLLDLHNLATTMFHNHQLSHGPVTDTISSQYMFSHAFEIPRVQHSSQYDVAPTQSLSKFEIYLRFIYYHSDRHMHDVLGIAAHASTRRR
jgi:hypothetical protein